MPKLDSEPCFNKIYGSNKIPENQYAWFTAPLDPQSESCRTAGRTFTTKVMAYMQFGNFLTLADASGNTDITVTTRCGTTDVLHHVNSKVEGENLIRRVENNTAETYWTGGFKISSTLWGCPFHTLELQDTTASNTIPPTDWLNIVDIVHEDNS